MISSPAIILTIMNLKKLDLPLSYFAIPFAYFLRVIFFFKRRSSKILIIRPGGMGDLVALTQAMDELNLDLNNYHFLIERRSEVWAKYLNLNFSCYDNAPLKTLLQHVCSYEDVMNTEQFFGLSQIYAVACTCSSGKISAFSTNRLSLLALNKIDYDPHNVHEVLSFARMFNPNISPSSLVKNAKNENKNNCVIWIAGGNSPSRTMRPEDYVLMMSNVFCKDVSIVAAPEDKEFALELKGLLTSQFENCELFNGSFMEACRHLSQTEFLVTVDSSPVHIGSYFGIKTHAIFTSGIINKWHPLTRGSMIYRNPEAKCAPCTLFGQIPPCPNSYLCKNISYEKPYRVEDFCPIFS